MSERTIFLAAMGISDRAERSAYLDQACGDDIELRRAVEALLHSHEVAGSFLEGDAQAVAETIDLPPVTEEPGTIIGNYRLMEKIGEGGMGVVYVAQQQRPYRRKVALKIIKPGMDTQDVIARFEAERQALALMDHPNIAQVLDGGATESGRPYFVMELVRGIPITDYCDRNNLSPDERLKLFAAVCQAVQHAHQKGIIHRDVKPSNVLVTLHDGVPVPKVIDFGVAKAINQQLTERTIYTRFAQMVGTPLYMSPEQAELSGLDVDTRSDIYSLGVLLYELLTGTTPFDRQRIREAAYDEIRRIIREEEPPKPSTKISTLGETASDISSHRSTDPKGLYQLVRGDLDWIVMKALEKDRTRRYDTASSFAADVQRFLNDQPIEARPPSAPYRIRKFVHRNKGPVAALLAVALALIAGIVGVSVLAAELQQERDAIQQLAGQLRDRNTILQRLTKQLQEKNHELCEQLKHNAMAYAMAGQQDKALPEIARARLAGATESWEQMVLGMIACYSPNRDGFDKAVAYLVRAVELDKHNVAARALLLKARGMTGKLENLLQEKLELEKYQPKTSEDYLFLAFQRVFGNRIEEGMYYIEKAIELRDSPFTRAVRAELRAQHALTTRKWDLAAKALEDIRAARAFMPDNPFVLHVALWVHRASIQLATAHEEMAKLHREAEQIAIELERYPDYVLGHAGRACYFEEHCRLQEAREAWETAARAGVRGLYQWQYAGFLYGEGDLDGILSLYSEDGDIDRLVHAIVKAEKPQTREEAIATLQEYASEGTNPIFVFSSLEHLYFLGEVDFAKHGFASLESRAPWSDIHSPFDKACIRFFAGDGDMDEDALRDIAAKTGNLCHAHYHIGRKCVGDRNLEMAKEHFDMCIKTRMIGGPKYGWARALLRRMEDPAWPPWIKAKEQDELPSENAEQ